jgi:hypothetical protein
LKKYFFAILLVCLCFSGCDGNGNVKISGTASYEDGTPLPKGIITISDDKSQYTGDVKSGKFVMGGLAPGSGIPPGNYKVYVSNCFDESGKNLVKDNYTTADKTPLTLEVVKGKTPPLNLKFEKAN